jgi:hypothetical protein
VVALLGAGAVVAIVLIGLRGAGGDSPEAAIYAIAHGVEHRNADTVCERLLPSTLLPEEVARTLDVTTNGGSPGASWESEHEACIRQFGKRGEFESLGFEDARVREVTDVPVTPVGGVTKAARALVSLEAEEPRPLPLVRYRGRWRLVFQVN